tara:strand:- start:688 stop:1758 length:1071 start_codon:yes stop_codon:yes gene_type:complete
MKLLPYLISSLIFVAGSYFTYTFYSSFNQTNTNENVKTLSTNIVNEKDVYQNNKSKEIIATNSIEKNNLLNEKIIVPKVDILKVSPDGSYIIAGKGKPNSTISILEKGNKIESVDADESGSWVIVSKDNLESGDNLLIINQDNIDGSSTQSKEIYVTKIDKKNETKPLVIEIENDDGGKLSIIQSPSIKKLESNVENNLTLSKKQINKKNVFKIQSVSFSQDGSLSIQGIANYGSNIEILVNKNLSSIFLKNKPEWIFNSSYKLGYGMHKLVANLKSQNNTILDSITLPFMRSEMPSGELPDNYVLIKPGDMLWTISFKIYGNPLKYIEIYEENRDQITNPDLIFPGQVFSIPKKN